MTGGFDAPAGESRLVFVVTDEDAGQRVDVAVAAVSGAPRAQVQRWIANGYVTVDDASCKSSHRLAVGETIEAVSPEPVSMSSAAEPIPLVVVYEDAQLIVVDKPAGMVVHPAPGHASGTLVNALLHHCGDLARVGGVLRPGIVHRLDRGTSGILVAAKTDAAHAALSAQFQDHTIHRRYQAFVRAVSGEGRGFVDQPIARHPRDRKKMSVREGGRPARTGWRVVERFPKARVSLLDVHPETGRTHQIRVHLAWAGMPLVGDPVYGRSRGGAGLGLERPALHAAELGFRHPVSGETLRFEVALPEDLARLLETLRRREGRLPEATP